MEDQPVLGLAGGPVVKGEAGWSSLPGVLGAPAYLRVQPQNQYKLAAHTDKTEGYSRGYIPYHTLHLGPGPDHASGSTAFLGLVVSVDPLWAVPFFPPRGELKMVFPPRVELEQVVQEVGVGSYAS